MAGIRTNYLYNIGDKIGKLEIINKIELKKTCSNSKNGFVLSKGYEYICMDCGYVDEKSESDIKRGTGCSVCSGKKVVKEINSLWKTHNYMCDVFDDIKDTYRYTYCSGKTVVTRCPECGDKRNMKIRDLYSDGYSCRKCGDNVSIPMKFIAEILRVSGVEFEQEASFQWSENKLYDIYVKERNTIIEVNGKQHYDGGFERVGGKNLQEEQNNDEFKKNLAMCNGISNYIILDCRKSSLDWLKKCVEHCDAFQAIVSSDVDMVSCYKVACCGRAKIVKDLWSNGINTSSAIAREMKVSQQSAVAYMKQCRDVGWCDYDEIASMRDGRARGQEGNKTKVICLDNGVIMDSIKEMICHFKTENGEILTNSGISGSCSGRYSNHKGYRFMYHEEYLKQNK